MIFGSLPILGNAPDGIHATYLISNGASYVTASTKRRVFEMIDQVNHVWKIAHAGRDAPVLRDLWTPLSRFTNVLLDYDFRVSVRFLTYIFGANEVR